MRVPEGQTNLLTPFPVSVSPSAMSADSGLIKPVHHVLCLRLQTPFPKICAGIPKKNNFGAQIA